MGEEGGSGRSGWLVVVDLTASGRNSGNIFIPFKLFHIQTFHHNFRISPKPWNSVLKRNF